MGVLGGGWTMESGGGQGRGGWIKESVNLVSVGGWVCVCVGVLSVGLGPGLDSMSPARSRRSASHAAGTHGWLPQKTVRQGHLKRMIKDSNCSSNVRRLSNFNRSSHKGGHWRKICIIN